MVCKARAEFVGVGVFEPLLELDDVPADDFVASLVAFDDEPVVELEDVDELAALVAALG
jgi:hypothetical protein